MPANQRSRAGDRQPLLPQYRDETTLQRELHKKLHTYQMLRALSKGYMPSTEQLIINLRTILAADILNPDNPELSDSGRRLVKYTRQWLTQFMDLLQHKNSNDQVQDFIWFLSKSRISLDTEDLANRASKAKAKADTAAVFQSLRTVGSLLLTNSDFRLFLSDLNLVAREVFKDVAFKVSEVAEETGKKLEPSEEDKKKLKEPGADEGQRPSGEDLGNEVAEVSKVLGNGALEVAKTAKQSVEDKVSGEEKEALIHRLKQVVLKLRKRNDYSDSVSTISLLIKRYAMVYSRALEEAASVVQDDVDTNPELDRAVKNFWSLISSFGDRKQWEELKNRFNQLLERHRKDPEFENLMRDVGDSFQKLLTDPDFLEHADEKMRELREKMNEAGSESSLREDVEKVLEQLQVTLNSVMHDEDIRKLTNTTIKIFSILFPSGSVFNRELLQDCLNVFVPSLIQAIQYVPIPRLEISVPEMDLLLENLIIEPGKTVNHSSFLPYKLRLETYNDLEIRKARFKTVSKVTSLVTIKLDGLTMRAEEIGYWMRVHPGYFRLADEGIASFAVDEKGVDIHLDVEIGKEKLEKILTLRAVRVHIHKLQYTLRKSKFAWLSWLLKPLLRPIIRKVMEKQLATAIADAIHAANRELCYARERLRATRIADPQDVVTFVKAVMARLTPEEDPDVYTRVGIAEPGKGVFRGVYAPGSIVKVWNEEGVRADEVVEDNEVGGWRNEVFDVHSRMMG